MTWLKPLPTITAENSGFFEGLRQREFRVLRCEACGHLNWTPYPACRTCLSVNQRWEAVSGKAVLYTYSVIHTGPRVFAQDGPYVLAVGKLVEQPRALLVMANLRGCPADAIRVGMPLRIAFEEVPGHDDVMYYFEPDQ